MMDALAAREAPVAVTRSTPYVDRPKPYVEIRNCTRIYQSARDPFVALRDVSASIADGEFVSVVGPSGCGKSTLMRCIAGLDRMTEGEIRVDGKIVRLPPTNLGVVFQRDLLLDWRTVLDNVLLTIEFNRQRRSDFRDAAMSLLRSYGLGGFENRYPWELSGGMRQRVAICRALIDNPRFLLMDEPFGALDAMTRDDLNAELQTRWLTDRKTVLFITHSIAEAVFLSDRVLVMDRNPGRIVAEIEIDMPRPRDISIRERPEFGVYVSRIRQLLTRNGAVTG
jgi:NitT/TauT family transport system ATP-binding protein